jgi:hypothetical protein
MKKLVFGTAFLLSGLLAHSNVIVSERTVELTVDISKENVKRSRAGYSQPTVKVLVPELADVTVFDHRNEGEGAPCLATFDTLNPGEVIGENPEVVKLPFTIKLVRSTFVDNGECHVFLEEEVVGDIRGFRFEHLRGGSVGKRHIDDCR